MDDLTYTYKNSGKSNQLARVSDAVTTTGVPEVEQFEDGNTSGDDYGYDNSGNLTVDLNKDIVAIHYNHLNKPTLIIFSSGQKIEYIYDAAGTKLRQKIFGNGGSSTTKETDYIGPFHYEDSDGDVSTEKPKLIFFSHEEGRVRRAGDELIYETFLKDHLGNVRVMFTDADGDGWVDPADTDEVLQVDHFYPFGLRMAGISTSPAVPNFYTFTGKEYQDELGLSWIDFGAQMLDPATGRWNGVDALANEMASFSPYNYVFNNPLTFTDPTGLAPVYRNGAYVDDEDENKTYTWNQVMRYLRKNDGIAASFKPNTVYSSFDDQSDPGSSLTPTQNEQQKIEKGIQRIYADNCISVNVEHVSRDKYLVLMGMRAELKSLNIALLNFTTGGIGTEGTTSINPKNGDEALSQVHLSQIALHYGSSPAKGTAAWSNYMEALTHIGAHELYHLYRSRAYILSGVSKKSAMSFSNNHVANYNLMTDGAIAMSVFIPGRPENTSANKKALNTFASQEHFFLISALFDHYAR